MMRFRAAAAVLLSAAVLGTPATADTDEREVSGSYVVTASPGAPQRVAAQQSCGGREARADRGVRSLSVPFGGWLTVRLRELTGDWDLALTDAAGRTLIDGAGQALGSVGPEEALKYYVRRGSRVGIVACNYAGGQTARVTYVLTEGPDGVPVPPQPRALSLELPYQGPAAGANGRWALCYVGLQVGCTATDPPRWTRFVSAVIDDQVSSAVAARLYMMAGSTSFPEEDFCTSLDKPVPVPPGTDWIGVVVLNGPCLDGTPAQATRGNVTLTFSSTAAAARR